MILAAAAALVLSAACTKSEITSSLNDEPQAIGFTNYVSRSLTKAATANYVASGSTLITDFGVYSWVKANATTPWSANNNLFTGAAEGAPTFMSNVDVTFGGDEEGDSGSNNTYTPLRYWPSGDTPSGLSFFAYYPYNAAGFVLPSAILGDATFTVQTTAAAQVDLMVSDVVADQYYGATNSAYQSGAEGTVDLKFYHMLTKVKFVFKTDNEDANTTVTLTNAQLSGIFTKNTLTNTYTKGATANAGSTTHEWGTANTAAGFDVTISGATPATTNRVLSTDVTACTDADTFLMVPQTIAADQQKIAVTWTVATTGSATITNTKTIDLNDIKNSGAHIDWAKNNQVTYTITIGPKPIRFTATVDTDWASVTNGTVSVN